MPLLLDRRHAHDAAIRRLHDLGVMINGSFVFGMDGDGRFEGVAIIDRLR